MTREQLELYSGATVQLKVNGIDSFAKLDSRNPSSASVIVSDPTPGWSRVASFTLEESDLAGMSINGTAIFSLIKLKWDEAGSEWVRD
jgi:hypothetical protein